MGLDGMASARGHRMQGTEHDIEFSLALGCAIALHCIALPVSYTHLRAHETSQDLVCRLLLEKKKGVLHCMASARGPRMQGTEHDIAFVLALGCAIALHCIALYCSVQGHRARMGI